MTISAGRRHVAFQVCVQARAPMECICTVLLRVTITPTDRTTSRNDGEVDLRRWPAVVLFRHEPIAPVEGHADEYQALYVLRCCWSHRRLVATRETYHKSFWSIDGHASVGPSQQRQRDAHQHYYR